MHQLFQKLVIFKELDAKTIEQIAFSPLTKEEEKSVKLFLNNSKF